MSADFQTVAQAALRACPGLLFAWLPGGRMHGIEYDVLNPTRDDHTTGNFRINTQTGKWSDFATGERGSDLIALRAWLDQSSQRDAAEEIERQLGLNGYERQGIDPAIAPFIAKLNRKPAAAESEQDVCLLPVPADAPPPPLIFGQPAWTYTNAHGELLGYVVRIDPPNGKKEFRPLTYWQAGGWQKKSWPRPAPLYGQSALAERLEAPVLVLEGEKTTDAGTGWFADFVSVTWPGGSSRAAHADWRQLAGRSVWLLPDADEPGKKAMTAVAEALRGIVAELHLAVLPTDLPQGWDVADFEGTAAEAEAWLAALTWRCLKGQPQETKPDSRFDAELQRANGQGARYAVQETTAPAFAPIPVPLLARLEAEILRRVPIQHPVAAQQTALAVAARIAGRHTLTTAGDPTSLYLALAAPSVGDVRPYLHQASAIMEQAGLSPSVRQSRLSVMTQIQKLLWRQPSLLYLCSEWGILLNFAKRQPAGSLEMALGMLADLWDAKSVVVDADDVKLPDADGGQQIIRVPHLSMLALLSHDQLAIAVKLSEMGRGALEQIQYWILDDDAFVVADPDALITAPYPDDIIAEIKRIHSTQTLQTGNLSGLTLPWVMPPQVSARFAVSIQPFYAALDHLKAHRSARSILTTSRLIIRRMANVLAYWLNPAAPLITVPIIEWCVNQELVRLRTLFSQFPTLSGDEGKASVYDKLLDYIASEKTRGARSSDLVSGCRAYRALDDSKRESLIKQLLADESIVEVQPESKPGARRKAPVYVARQFVNEVGK